MFLLLALTTYGINFAWIFFWIFWSCFPFRIPGGGKTAMAADVQAVKKAPSWMGWLSKRIQCMSSWFSVPNADIYGKTVVFYYLYCLLHRIRWKITGEKMFPYQAYGAVRQLYLNKKPGDAGNPCKTEISNQRFLVGDSKKQMPWCETPRRWVLVVENTMIMCRDFFLFQFSELRT